MLLKICYDKLVANVPLKETITLPANLIFKKLLEIRITRKQSTKLFQSQKYFKICEVVLCRRYVDEIISFFACEKDADKFVFFFKLWSS